MSKETTCLNESNERTRRGKSERDAYSRQSKPQNVAVGLVAPVRVEVRGQVSTKVASGSRTLDYVVATAAITVAFLMPVSLMNRHPVLSSGARIKSHWEN